MEARGDRFADPHLRMQMDGTTAKADCHRLPEERFASMECRPVR